MIHPTDIHTLTDFKRNSGPLLERLASDRPQVLTVDGKPRAVVLGVELFERWWAIVDEVETKEAIRKGLAAIEAGETMSLEEAEIELRKRLGLRPKRGSTSA